jgi:hypothetical protein
MCSICKEADELFALHSGLRELKIVRGENGKAQVVISDEDDLALFGSPSWGKK